MTTFLPSRRWAVAGAKTCLYTNTPDGHFIIDSDPENPGVLIACGFSGHGFKFASVIGDAWQTRACRGNSMRLLGFWD